MRIGRFARKIIDAIGSNAYNRWHILSATFSASLANLLNDNSSEAEVGRFGSVLVCCFLETRFDGDAVDNLLGLPAIHFQYRVGATTEDINGYFNFHKKV